MVGMKMMMLRVDGLQERLARHEGHVMPIRKPEPHRQARLHGGQDRRGDGKLVRRPLHLEVQAIALDPALVAHDEPRCIRAHRREVADHARLGKCRWPNLRLHLRTSASRCAVIPCLPSCLCMYVSIYV